jgi:hypothetical protein
MQHKGKPLIASILLVGMISSPVLGQFAVIDVAAIAKLASQLETAAKTLTEIAAIYIKVSQQYDQAVYMAKYSRNLANYRMIMTAWQGMVATNDSGTTLPWVNSINNGLNVSGGFLNSTYGRPPFTALAGLIPAIQRARAQMEYGTMELRDGTSESAMQTIGAMRLHGSQSETALNLLEQDSMSLDPDSNTTATLLNKINAAGMVNARMASDTNKALVNQAEMQLIGMKERHDAEAAMVENEIAFRTIGMNELRAQHAGFADAMMNFRMP